MTDAELFAAWKASDDRMQTELVRLFGKKAGDARYDSARKGWSGEAIMAANEFQRLSRLVHAYWERRYARQNCA